MNHCPLLLSISHGSAQTAGAGVWEALVKGSGNTAGVSRALGEGLWEQSASFLDELCELQAHFVLGCSAAKPCSATRSCTAALPLCPCPGPLSQVAGGAPA